MSVAPIATQILIEAFGALLVSSGMYTQEQVNYMSWGEVQTNVGDGISSGVIGTSDIVVDGQLWLVEQGITNAAVIDVVGTAVDVWFETLTKEDVVLTPTTDLKGATCAIKYYSSDGSAYMYYANCTGVINSSQTHGGITDVFWYQWYDKNGNLVTDMAQTSSSLSAPLAYGYQLYGSWTYSDGSIAPTADETAAEVGETADGEQVTLDDIQSGTVSADDTTLDYDKFNDEAIIDLLSQILATLENVPVVEENDTTYDDAKENIQAATGELDMAELNNLQMPLGILDVFPFCLPVDFVRGMKLLSAEPETPYFEVNIVVPSFLGVPEQKWDFVIDFEMLEPLAIITRWTSLLSFSYVLIFASTKIVKGAGA